MRNKLFGTASRPRMTIFRSNKRIEVQFIDDEARITLVGVSSSEKNKGAKSLGLKAAEEAKSKLSKLFLIV